MRNRLWIGHWMAISFRLLDVHENLFHCFSFSFVLYFWLQKSIFDKPNSVEAKQFIQPMQFGRGKCSHRLFGGIDDNKKNQPPDDSCGKVVNTNLTNVFGEVKTDFRHFSGWAERACSRWTAEISQMEKVQQTPDMCFIYPLSGRERLKVRERERELETFRMNHVCKYCTSGFRTHATALFSFAEIQRICGYEWLVQHCNKVGRNERFWALIDWNV